jgi:hypothetical protein
MHNASFLMQIFQCLSNLNDNMPGQILTKVCESHDLMKELPARTELENDVVILSRLGKVNELDNIGMIQLSHDLNFFQNIGSLWKMTSVV